MSALQSRERVLAELGVRSVTVRPGDDLDAAATILSTEPQLLARLVDAAARDGEAIEASANLGAWAEGDAVKVCSTSSVRADAMTWAGVAHELRNALTTIGGWAQVASDSPDDASVRRAMQMVLASAREAMDVAPLLLEKATPGESAEVARVVKQVVERFAPVAASRDVTLRCRRIEDAEVGTSRAALSSIVANLVKNAIEACESKGRVDVAVRSTNAGIEIIVEDDGRGMPEDAVRERFGSRAVRPSADGAPTGRGIGLSVVRALVTRAGGSARVTSRVGAGSCVRVQLPRSQRTGKSSGVRERSSGHRVLVVDDHAALCELVVATLTARGAVVFATAEPALAIAAATEEAFDVALIDLDLGESSGATLVRTLVATRLARRVIVMSGATAVPDLGADGVLRKPFDLIDVEEIALAPARTAIKADVIIPATDKKRRAR